MTTQRESTLELAQLVIEAVPGDVIQVRADGDGGAGTVTCEVSENATRSGTDGRPTGKYQLFVDFAAAPTLSLFCSEGFF